MARRFPFVNSFSAGEIAPSYLMRTDSQARNEAAALMSNVRLLPGGGFTRRPGTLDLHELSDDCRLETVGVGADDVHILAFSPHEMRTYTLTGVPAGSVVVDVPWTADDLWDMQVAIEDDRIVVSSRSFWPQILTRDAAGDWSISDFIFASGLNGATLQPYWRYAPRGVALTVSAYTGAVNLQTTAAFFEAGHVGTKIRYTDVEITVATVVDSTHATGTVVGSLYPTVTAHVESSTGFLVGQVVEGLDSQIQGVVASVPDSTSINIQLVDGYTLFDWAAGEGDTPASGEDIVGPTAKSKQTAQATIYGTPSATVEWDEQMISSVRGYPGACAFHRTRLLLGDFPAAKNALAASTIGDITNFDVGTGLDTDAIIELVSRETSLEIKHFGSTEQLLIFTEAGPYFVAEDVQSPLSPTNFEIFSIGPEAAGAPTPVRIAEGMLFSEGSSGRVMGVLPTGTVRRPWEIADLSELAFHMMGEPRELRLLAATTESDRLLCLLKRDGDIATMTYRRGSTVSAWTNWSTSGAWRSSVTAGGKLFVAAKRRINEVFTYRLEVFDPAALGDGVVEMAPDDLVPQFAGETIGVWSGTAKLGDFAVDDTGALVGLDTDADTVTVGYDFEVRVDLVPPIDPAMGLRPKLRICRADVDVLDSGAFTVNGYDPNGFNQPGEFGGDMVPTSGVRRFRTLGRSKDASVSIRQDVGAPLNVRSVTMEVTS